MKILFLVFFSLNLFASHIDDFSKEMNFHRDYNTALTQAKQENKLLVMILSADYCPWCRKFENKTLKYTLIHTRLNNEVITLVVDKKYDIKSFPKKFKTQFTPRVFFINPHKESILSDSSGYIKKKEFLKLLDQAKANYKASK